MTPITFNNTWPKASAYCNGLNASGQGGWRQPTVAEVRSLYEARAMNVPGWMVGATWTSESAGRLLYRTVNTRTGWVEEKLEHELWVLVACVRPSAH